jgi:hypothetical protein
MASHTNIQDHQDNCCVIHGCRYGDFDCPIFTGNAPKNKKNPCLVCEGAYKDSKIAHEIVDQYSTLVFSDSKKLRTFMTKLIRDGYGTNYKRVEKNAKVIEYRLVPIREISMDRFKEEHEIRKRFK